MLIIYDNVDDFNNFNNLLDDFILVQEPFLSATHILPFNYKSFIDVSLNVANYLTELKKKEGYK